MDRLLIFVLCCAVVALVLFIGAWFYYWYQDRLLVTDVIGRFELNQEADVDRSDKMLNQMRLFVCDQIKHRPELVLMVRVPRNLRHGDLSDWGDLHGFEGYVHKRAVAYILERVRDKLRRQQSM